MSERNLISSMLTNRESWNLVGSRLTDGDLSEQGRIIVQHIGEYYDRDDSASFCDPELLNRDIARSLSNPKHKETFSTLVTDLAGLETSAANVVHDFIATRRDVVGNKLASALASGKPIDDVRPLLDEYDQWAKAEKLEEAEESEVVLQGASFADLVRTNYQPGQLIEILPTQLNDRLDGGCLRGHHVILFARPEAGKTLFLVNAIKGFMDQGLRVLYVGNEDPIVDVYTRVISRLLGMTKYEAMDDPDTAEALVWDKYPEFDDQLRMVQMAPGTPREIERHVIEYKPDVLLVDQLRNLEMKSDNFTLKLEAAAKAVRNMGQRHKCLVISVTQAGNSAENKDVLDMGDVADSNTGVPAQADVMVGLGMTFEDGNMNRRVISLPKNKRSGKHEFFPVRINPQGSSMGGIQ